MALAGHMPPTAAVAAQGSGGGDSLFGGFGSSLLAPSRPSGEVHDRVLALVEDFARGLPDVPTFRRTYERLLVRDMAHWHAVVAVCGSREGEGGVAV